jgi:hypothetical protein
MSFVFSFVLPRHSSVFSSVCCLVAEYELQRRAAEAYL